VADNQLRRETPPNDSVIVVRGGRDTIEKLELHAKRTARRWTLNGVPLEGVSVFCALDQAGSASLDRVLSAMRTYRYVHLVEASELRAAGFALLATGRRPHFTLHAATGSTLDVRALWLRARRSPTESEFGTGRMS
jgi:hypothetical protein